MSFIHFSSDLAQETLMVAGPPHSLRHVRSIILPKPLAAAVTTVVLTAQPYSRNLEYTLAHACLDSYQEAKVGLFSLIAGH